MNASSSVPEGQRRASYVVGPITFPKRHVSDQRLKPYMDATYDDEEKAMILYVWGRKLSASIFHDVSILEVALHNALDRALVGQYGKEWFRLRLFDKRAFDQIVTAWESLPAPFRDAKPGDGKIRGRLLAGCMFGTWSALLDAGGASGLPAPCAKVDHDLVWDRSTLLVAFPGARKLAGSERARLDRDWVHRQVKEVHVLRDRIAHHESLVNGYPIPGTGQQNRPPERRTLEDGITACTRLAEMLDQDLAGFLAEASDTRALYDADPRHSWGFKFDACPDPGS
ncbi:hypothetical protein L5I01_30085 [Gordonia sp. HY442]|uniref:hypothetical protein n=1 Tax=Gordonia zhenghanii TaxID=2911516 RepID=UPI001F361283|nr:hypothetical protein [Gordonia zhenghanii]MCF8607614.1 hypothetical protein [Gordonia zhenghanii]